jgi:hypothetical protein
MSQEPGDVQDTILRVLQRNRLAVLATQRDGQPHASLMAFTPLAGLRFLAFATYRETLKYESIWQDPRVAILVEDRVGDLRLLSLTSACSRNPAQSVASNGCNSSNSPGWKLNKTTGCATSFKLSPSYSLRLKAKALDQGRSLGIASKTPGSGPPASKCVRFFRRLACVSNATRVQARW